MRISKTSRFLLAAAAITLAACFPVEDLGNSWAKARMDPRLAGRWRTVAVFGDLAAGSGRVGQIVQFKAVDGAYQMSDTSGRPPATIRTLTAGKYEFLLFNEGKSGTLIRYRATATQLEFYMDNGPEALAFIQKSFPRAVHVKKNAGEGEYARITLLDDEALSILSKIPDHDPYWVLVMKSERIP